ncbi:MAG: NADAR family protein [Lachnospiraceae bacterium]|nr:NADAR family protein [Lachnospiraceae bacterium]
MPLINNEIPIQGRTAEQTATLMPPPWLACPEIERYSIGWRMGYGEDYLSRFSKWLAELSQEERMEYQNLFPEPVTWSGWWEHKDAGEVLTHGEYSIPLWQHSGLPKYSRNWLCEEISQGRLYEYSLFWGHQTSKDGSISQSCLSQWWMADFWSAAQTYCCMEQYMMEQKAELFQDEEIRQQILESSSPKQIKALGRKVQGFDQNVWDRAKYSIVLNGNWCKFSQNPNLRDFLLSTGDCILAEASPYDAIWGIRLSSDAPEAKNPWKWRGQNLLGFALMEVRDELRRIRENEALCDWSLVK